MSRIIQIGKSTDLVMAGAAIAAAGGLLISLSGQLPPGLPPQVTAAATVGCWIGGGALVAIGSIIVIIGGLL